MTALSPDLPAPPDKSPPPERRDPAWRGRLAGAAVALVLTWPMLVVTEFKPWLPLAPGAQQPSPRFWADFAPPRLAAELPAQVTAAHVHQLYAQHLDGLAQTAPPAPDVPVAASPVPLQCR